MIESFHALVTNVAMSGVSSTDHFTFRAEQVGFKFFNKTHERNIWGPFHETRRNLNGQHEESHWCNEDHNEQGEPAICIDVCKKKIHVVNKALSETYMDRRRPRQGKKFQALRPRTTILSYCSSQFLPWAVWNGNMEEGRLASWEDCVIPPLFHCRRGQPLSRWAWAHFSP